MVYKIPTGLIKDKSPKPKKPKKTLTILEKEKIADAYTKLKKEHALLHKTQTGCEKWGYNPNYGVIPYIKNPVKRQPLENELLM